MNAWSFAVKVYGRGEVMSAALELQNRHHQCVGLLLWRLWAAKEGRPVESGVMDLAVTAARMIETHVLGPSRAIRVFLKAPHPLFVDAARDGVRTAVGAGELAAERMLIDSLEALTPPSAGPPVDLVMALREAVQAWGRPAPEDLLAKLAAAC